MRSPSAACRPTSSRAQRPTRRARKSRLRPIRPARSSPRCSRPASTRSCRSSASSAFTAARSRKTTACTSPAGGRTSRSARCSKCKGARRTPIDAACPGDIVAIAKTEDLHTGTTLGNYVMPPIKFPTPMVGLAVTPKSRGDEAKLSGALHKIVEEDSDVPPRSRSADQGTGDDRHERAASHRAPRAAQDAATKSKSTRKSRKFPIAKRSSTRPKEATATRSNPAAAASSAKCTSACSRFPHGTESRGILHEGALSLDAEFHYRPEVQFPVGRFDRRRHDSRTTSCRRSKRVSRSGSSAA